MSGSVTVVTVACVSLTTVGVASPSSSVASIPKVMSSPGNADTCNIVCIHTYIVCRLQIQIHTCMYIKLCMVYRIECMYICMHVPVCVYVSMCLKVLA